MDERELLKTALLEASNHIFKYSHALKKIAMRWFDPAKKEGACVADCEAGLPKGNPHAKHCPFQIAKEALGEL